LYRPARPCPIGTKAFVVQSRLKGVTGLSNCRFLLTVYTFAIQRRWSTQAAWLCRSGPAGLCRWRAIAKLHDSRRHRGRGGDLQSRRRLPRSVCRILVREWRKALVEARIHPLHHIRLAGTVFVLDDHAGGPRLDTNRRTGLMWIGRLGVPWRHDLSMGRAAHGAAEPSTSCWVNTWLRAATLTTRTVTLSLGLC